MCSRKGEGLLCHVQMNTDKWGKMTMMTNEILLLLFSLPQRHDDEKKKICAGDKSRRD